MPRKPEIERLRACLREDFLHPERAEYSREELWTIFDRHLVKLDGAWKQYVNTVISREKMRRVEQ